ncbi:CapA family protein [Vallitalea okinawensis]|uniref:CapA family protein n=1 Tax=Vallitalea okinawensis TaxID=2078660 RepID=UPI000CFC890C|nr:CapA family protein [Vallitalea okinawensis]
MRIKLILIKALLHIIGFFKGSRYKYSQEYEDNFLYMDLGEKLWWAYKAVIKQIENAEKGKNIESYFANQNLDFSPNDSFKVDQQVTLTAGGDLNCSDIIYPESTEHLWDDIEDFYFSGDIVCANLESPLDPSKPLGVVPSMCLTAPNLNTSPEMFERYARDGKGINFFSTANNHSLDQGESSLIATLDFLDSKGYPHVGTSRTPEEQKDIPIIEQGGIRIAFLSYTYCLNGFEPIPGKEYMTNVIRLNKPDTDISLIKEHIKIAHEKKADIIVAMLHWSIEFETYPIENIINMGHRIMECGVDIILGGHPHVLQPMEKYSFVDPYSKHKKEGFIIYSLGELVSYNAFSKNSRLTAILKLQISKGMQNDASITKITNLKILPTYTWARPFIAGKSDYRLLNFRSMMKQLEMGENPHGFTNKEIKELERLEALLYNKFLPQNADSIISD